MVRIVLDVETSDIIGTKELLAMALEKLGKASVILVESLDKQMEV